MTLAPPKKVVLAYSGGLDTSIILKWLQTEYQAEVVTFTADLGQGEEVEPARRKAELLGIKPENIFIEDVREEFVRDYVSARHLDRPTAHRQAPDRDRAEGRRRRGLPRRHRQGERPGPLRARLLCAGAGHPRRRPLARVAIRQPRAADPLRRAAPDSDFEG
jgi:tRNA(Ile)-lysidine synthase TilS/MesJ